MYLLEESENPSGVFYQKIDTGNIRITGSSPEVLSNALYQDQRIDLG